MKLSHSLRCIILATVSIFAVAPALHAATEKELVASMQTRLQAVTLLKQSGKVGEANTGLLVMRGKLERAERRVLADENRDRLAYYKQLAARIGAPLTKVQAERAEDIRERTPAGEGVWLQAASGDWYQK